MTKILLLSRYSRMGASSRLRTMQYIPYLEEHGYDIHVSSLFDNNYLTNLYKKNTSNKYQVMKLFIKRLFILFSIKKYDYIWLEYEVFPYFPAVFEKIFRLLGVKVVVDYDDAIFHRYDLSNKPLIKKILSKKIDKVMKFATIVIVGNNYLKQRAINANQEINQNTKKTIEKKIILMPTVIDLERYKVKKSMDVLPIVIGWIGSPATQNYVIELAPIFDKLSANANITLHLIGATKEIASYFTHTQVKVLPWQEKTEVDNIREMDIGIMPLKNGPWEQGKCGYKLIQYMACSLPVIASKVGANIDILNYSHCGLLADSQQDWFDALSLLVSKPELRKKYGNAGRVAVENKYSIQVQQKKLLTIFTSLY